MTFSTNSIIALDLSQNYLNYIKKLNFRIFWNI
jgi:hypothetical protein